MINFKNKENQILKSTSFKKQIQTIINRHYKIYPNNILNNLVSNLSNEIFKKLFEFT